VTQPQKNRNARPAKRSRIFITGGIAIVTAVSSAWLTHEPILHCDSLAPLTVLATLAAFIISICFRQMGRFSDKRSRLILVVFLLIAAGTLFADFRYVRKYRAFCDELQQQMRPVQPNR
jgi:glucan phosphoethanolaminetransferase (alkaline phosphatase superfamily)